jgi:hypothetical protein
VRIRQSTSFTPLILTVIPILVNFGHEKIPQRL